MKRRIFFILVLLCTLSGYAQISVGRDSLVIDPLKDEFMQEADEDGLYKIVTEVNELSSEDSAVRSEVLSLDAPLLKPPLKPLDPFEPLEPLDPLLPAPPSLPELPSTVEIDRAKAVGEIPIQSRIENGSLTYSVPIEIYGGKNGHQPALALSYNSLMGNSIAGYGWCIGGLSYISICNSNYYYDGSNAKPASLDKNSAYSLDGSRLIKISETSSQIDYQTEHGNVKVTFYAPSGKYYFDVWYPDGNIIRKTKRFAIPERAVYFLKTKRTAGVLPHHKIFSTGLRRYSHNARTESGHHPNPVLFVLSLRSRFARFALRSLDYRLIRSHALRPHEFAAEGQARADIRIRIRGTVIRTRTR